MRLSVLATAALVVMSVGIAMTLVAPPNKLGVSAMFMIGVVLIAGGSLTAVGCMLRLALRR